MSISMEPNYWGPDGRGDRKPRKPRRRRPRVQVDDDEIPVKVTKKPDGEGWRRVIAGRRRKNQVRLILDDRRGQICLLDDWVTPDKVPNLIAALREAVAEIDRRTTE